MKGKGAKFAAVAVPLGLLCVYADAFAEAVQNDSRDMAADAYFSPLGVDTPSGASRIRVHCTHAKPCRTVEKAIEFLAWNIANTGASRDYKLLFDAGNGPFYLSRTVVLTSGHTVDAGHETIFGSYNDRNGGEKAAWSGGVDIAGSWGVAGAFGASVALPSGAPACASNYLVGSAPLNRANIRKYAGVAWINSHRVPQVTNPRVGGGWAQIPGACMDPAHCPDVGTSVFAGPTVQITNGSASYNVSDLTKVGEIGQIFRIDLPAWPTAGVENGAWASGKAIITANGMTFSVGATYGVSGVSPSGYNGRSFTALAGSGASTLVYALPAYPGPYRSGGTAAPWLRYGHGTPLWIVAKDAGGAGTPGNIQLSLTPGGAPIIGPATITANVSEPLGRSMHPEAKNKFPYNPVTGEFASAYNQTDVKAQVAATSGGPDLVPVASVSGGYVTLNSRVRDNVNIYPTVGYRVWNRFEDLGVDGYSGELYNDRTTGWLYYTPRTDLGETCANINARGKAILPSTLETLVKISSAAADIATAGAGAPHAPVGNFTFQNMLFEHTNSSILTGSFDVGGAIGGFQGRHMTGEMLWAITTIGATNVHFVNYEASHLAGNAFGMSWGTNHSSIRDGKIYDAGGSAITAGGAVGVQDPLHYPADIERLGTTIFGPTTPHFTGAAAARNEDPTGNSDCCQAFANNLIYHVGLLNITVPCVYLDSGQRYTFMRNTVHDCPYMGMYQSNESGEDSRGLAPPVFDGLIGGLTIRSAMYYPFYGNSITYNEIYNCGYGVVLAAGGAHPPGASIPGDTQNWDFGCLYMYGSQDGDGTDPAKRLLLAYNKIHDISGATSPIVTLGIPASIGYDALTRYNDAWNVNGVNEHHNLYYNRSESAVGQRIAVRGMIALKGMLRYDFSNNIVSVEASPAGTSRHRFFPGSLEPGWTSFVKPGNSGTWAPNTAYSGCLTETCYIVNGNHIYATAIGGVISAASWSSGEATVTAPGMTFAAGLKYAISGVSPAGYNGAALTALPQSGGNRLVYAIAVDPGAFRSGAGSSAGQMSAPAGSGPTCTSGTCSDGAITWTYVETLPGNPHTYMSFFNNIFNFHNPEMTPADCGKLCPLFVNAWIASPYLLQSGDNLYSKSENQSNWYHPTTKMAYWKTVTGANGQTQELGSLYGASGAAWASNTTLPSCANYTITAPCVVTHSGNQYVSRIPAWQAGHAYSCPKTCYVTSANRIYATAGTGISGDAAPDCLSGTCVDGAGPHITWTYAPSVPALTTGTSAPGCNGRGATCSDGVVTWLWVQAIGHDVPGVAANFVDAFGGNFAFNATQAGPGDASPCRGVGPNGAKPGVSPACSLGFTPWDYNDVGAKPAR